jgi:RNA polymerase sigma-70 factor (sigma-E family)
MVAVEQPGWTADEAVTRLFAAHYRSLVRLASLLLSDPHRAEEVTQDAYVGLHRNWQRLRDPDRALAYLRQAVVNASRSVLRHRVVVDRHAAAVRSASRAVGEASVPSAEAGALSRLEQDAVLAAVAGLPARQREALVLRYYADLSEAEIAETMGCSRGAVKSHTARGVAALRARMETWS